MFNCQVHGWFLHDMWLKFIINLIFTFGFWRGHDWQSGIIFVLAASVATIVRVRPFLQPVR